MLSSNNLSEVRPDSDGALKEGVEKSERINSKESDNRNYPEKNKLISRFIYDFDTKKYYMKVLLIKTKSP